MTHCRFSCEKPRSVWIDGSATFTTAMSSTTMNCTVQRRASANHLRRDDVIWTLPFVSPEGACDATALTFEKQVRPSTPIAEALCCRWHGQAVRPVLPDRARALAG